MGEPKLNPGGLMGLDYAALAYPEGLIAAYRNTLILYRVAMQYQLAGSPANEVANISLRAIVLFVRLAFINPTPTMKKVRLNSTLKQKLPTIKI